MTPKEKALELVLRMQHLHPKESEKGKIHFLVMKQTAILQSLIAVDEILKYFKNNGVYSNLYWIDVKKEIEKL
jgi:hypothetical protein